MEMEFSITRYRNGEELFTEAEKDAKIKEGMNEDDFDEEEIVLSVEFDGEWVDEGLGETEFWGIVENDVDWQYEVEDFDRIVDEDGNDWSDRLTSEEMAELEDAAEEYGADEDPLEDHGRDPDDYDPDDYDDDRLDYLA